MVVTIKASSEAISEASSEASSEVNSEAYGDMGSLTPRNRRGVGRFWVVAGLSSKNIEELNKNIIV